jgi:predicted nucleotidyltransferase
VKKIDRIIKEFKEKNEKLYGSRLKGIVLYGSWARGESTEHSDIDLAVILEGEVIPGKEIDKMIDIITEIGLKYRTLISVYPVSENIFYTTKSPLLINIRKEGIPA